LINDVVQEVPISHAPSVDGRTPAPVDMVVDITLFTGFYTSQVVQDFFHQQYQIMVEGWWFGVW